MHHVFYAGFCFDTTDALAGAVVRCSRALASIGRLELVDLPVVFDGEQTRVQLLLGAGIPIAAAAFLGGAAQMTEADEAFARVEMLTAEATSFA